MRSIEQDLEPQVGTSGRGRDSLCPAGGLRIELKAIRATLPVNKGFIPYATQQAEGHNRLTLSAQKDLPHAIHGRSDNLPRPWLNFI